MTPPEHDVPASALDRFARGRARPRERRYILLHLLAGCPVCRSHLRDTSFPPSEQLSPGAYDEAFAAAAAAVKGALPRVHPAVLLRQLDRLAPEHRELKVRNQGCFASLPLVTALVERSHALRYQDPAGMLRNARLAVAVAEAITPGVQASSQVTFDARSRAWGELGNAHRIRSELAAAERAFAEAFHCLKLGSGDPSLRAELCRLLASLRFFERDFKAALGLLTEAVAFSHRQGDRKAEAMGLMKIGMVAIVSGNPQAALRPFRFAFRTLSGPQDKALQRGALINLLRCWIDLGRPERAYTICVDAEPLMEGCIEETVRLRWEWHRGMIDRDLGLLDAAETRLRRAREGFSTLDLPIEVAVISLDLAMVYLRAGKVPQALQAVADAIPIFRALGIQRDLLAALIQFGKIAHQTERALAVIQRIAAHVRDGIAPARRRRARSNSSDES